MSEENLKEKMAILLQRRYNIMHEIKRLTDDLDDAFSRSDDVSAGLVLRMRSDQFSLCEQNWEALLMIGEESREGADLVRRLLRPDPENVRAVDPLEEKIVDIRRGVRRLIAETRAEDRMISLRNAREKSAYYAAEHHL